MSANVNSSLKNKFVHNRENIHIGITFLLAFGVGFLPTFGTLTPVGMKILGAFLGIMYGWSFCGILWPSLLGLIAMGLSGVMDFQQLLLTAFSNTMVPFLICMLILVQMLIDSGAMNAAVNWILTRKFLYGRPWMFTLTYMMAIGILSIFNAFAAMFLGWALLYDVFRSVGYKPYEPYPTFMIVMTVFACSCTTIIPFLNTPFVILGIYSSMTGTMVNYGQYMALLIPLVMVEFVAMILAGKFILRPNVERLKTFDMRSVLEEQRITKHQKGVLIAFGIAFLVLMLPLLLPKNFIVTQILNMLGNTGALMVLILIFILIPVDKKPLLDFKKAAANGVDWGIVLMIMTVLTLATVFVADATGIKAMLMATLGPVLSHFSGMTFVILTILLGILLTNFMNNMVVAVLLVPVVVTVGSTLGMSPIIPTILIIFATNSLPYLTPAASPAAAIVYGNKEWCKPSGVFKVGVMIVIVGTLVLLAVGIPLGSVIFG